jgi:peptide methionine sulfoxide reductase msrA/msrB
MSSIPLFILCASVLLLALGCCESNTDTDSATPPSDQTASAIFAGGCFWGVEHHLQAIPGVHSVTSGYTGGSVENPTYKQVCSGDTGHAETVEVIYDPMQINYAALAKRFFEIHDPTTLDRQGPDKGTQYRSAIFYANADQKQTAESLIAQLRKNGYDVVTELVHATKFYPAEEYHQDYIENHPSRLCHTPVPRFDTPAE